jgi:hypothetical protein
LKQYYDFLVVNRRMQHRVTKYLSEYAARFLKSSQEVISEAVLGNIAIFLSKKPETYNNQLGGLCSFVGRFLNRMDITERSKRVYQLSSYGRVLPTKRYIRKGFQALEPDDEKALYLIYASSGIRKSGALKLCENDVYRALRCLKPKHDTRAKKTRVSFFYEECALYLNRLGSGNPRIFYMETDRFDNIWH